MRSGRILFILGMLCAWALIFGCSRPAPESDPRAVLTAYLEAVIEGRNEDAAQYLAANAKRPGGKQENGSFEEKMVRRVLASHVSFEILKIETTDGRGRADVKIVSPDFSRIAEDISEQLTDAEFPRDGLEALEHTAQLVNSRIRLYKSRGIPVMTSVRIFRLTNEGGIWKIAGEQTNG